VACGQPGNARSARRDKPVAALVEQARKDNLNQG
jgi:hypothetical protein